VAILAEIQILMNKSSEKSRSDVLSALRAHFQRQLKGARAEHTSELAGRYYARVPMDELRGQSTAHLSGLLLSHLDIAQQRIAGHARVRVFNPIDERDGWESLNSIVEIVTDDMPFLVDSVTMAIGRSHLTTHLVIHPIIHVQRDAGGHLMAAGLDPEDNDALRESWMHFEIERQTDPVELRGLQESIQTVVDDVRVCVTDWKSMAEAAQKSSQDLRSHAGKNTTTKECAAFVEWMLDDNFTFLGYEEMEAEKPGDPNSLRRISGSQLGLLSRWDNGGGGNRPSLLGQYSQRPNIPDEPVIITKTFAPSTVHRGGYMDYVGIQRFNKAGQIIGEMRIVGLFTSVAYSRRPSRIPFVREKIKWVMDHSGLHANSHGEKALLHILDTLPRDELFQSHNDELAKLAMGVLDLQERQRSKLFIRTDLLGSFYSCMVFIPRDRFNTETRERIQNILRTSLSGERVDFTVQVSEANLARLHVILRPKGPVQRFDLEAIESKLVEAVRSWIDELTDTLIDRHGEHDGLQLANRYGRLFPAAYREDVSPWVASFDVEKLDRLGGVDDLSMSLYWPRSRNLGLLRFKVFKYGATIPLTDALPMLENMGLKIVSERPYEVGIDKHKGVWIQDFDMIPDTQHELDLGQVSDIFQEAFEHAWRGGLESDGFNKLILLAQLPWRDVAMLRAYCRYLLQTGLPFSQPYMENALVAHPHVARVLIELFYARLDPDREQRTPEEAAAAADSLQQAMDNILPDDADVILRGLTGVMVAARMDTRDAQIEACQDLLRQALIGVSSLDEDRILRAFIDTVRATLRTNFFKLDRQSKPLDYISFKLDSSKIPDLPEPRPLYEIFVYSPRVEAIHLRGGMVARGGLRWSDRKEDFRTEVLGLMKAQTVKNAVIVPVGAKGGFVVKRMPDTTDRDQIMAEVIACYRMLVSGLLDLTDNYEEDGVTVPERVLRHDGEDPYLVVAADKGTASFSDIANSVAEDYGFWLGDAFASGGSVGYDHKKMGITARGAWESVKQHFHEMGVNCQTTDFTCVGIGDMSGDVFGNGMLLSKHTRLVAAFNHLHILIDPSPDAKASFKERQRLFNLLRSSWSDYDQKLISKGGGVFSRNVKRLELTPEIRELLDISSDSITPDQLISKILCADVELLWNGGIGTYVKSSAERHQDVGDRSNDELRVDATQLRCRIVGEGGNLGFTQRARVEYALHGGRINTDFIDNAAGVNCSDHEVNIKILLNDVVTRKGLNKKQRNGLLAEMTDAVAALVLRDNYLQPLAISMMERLSAERLGAKVHFIKVLESQGFLDPELEFLPNDDEIAGRHTDNRGLTRPELCVLLSYAKMSLYSELIDSDVPEDSYLSRELVRYFPEPLQEKYAKDMENHRLRREIICTKVTNSLVNRMGATFAMRMREDTGSTSAQVARAYSIARGVFKARDFWAKVTALDGKVTTDIQLNMNLQMWNLMRQATRWLLNRNSCGLDVSEAVARFTPGVKELQKGIDKLAVAHDRRQQELKAERLAKTGVPKPLARQVAGITALYSALDICDVALKNGRSVTDVASVYIRFGEFFKLDWLARAIESLPVEGQWHAHARGALRDDLFKQRRRLTSLALEMCTDCPVSKVVKVWAKENDAIIRPALLGLSEMRTLTHMDYATVLVALRNIVGMLDKVGSQP